MKMTVNSPVKEIEELLIELEYQRIKKEIEERNEKLVKEEEEKELVKELGIDLIQ